MSRPVNVERLQSNIAWAVAHGLGARDLIPMLERLVEYAEHGSECSLQAQQQLAELIVEERPWRAALLVRSVLRSVEDDRAWAVLGLAHTLMGNLRSARKAYQRALALAPGCPSYAHNLGHLLDVGFGQPTRALHYLQLAHRHAPDEREISASFAHALLHAGQEERALRVLAKALGDSARATSLLSRWKSRSASKR